MKKFALRFLITLFIASAVVPQTVHASATLPTSETTVPSSEIVDNALKEFKSLSKSERKARLKEARKAYRDMRKEGTDAVAATGSTSTVLLVILAILLPPLAVYLHEGEINTKFWISLLLTLLFWLPGIIYALLVIFGEA